MDPKDAPSAESAFPIPNDDRPGAYPAEPGMTLRDYFAAKAMQGMLSHGFVPDQIRQPGCVSWDYAKHAYAMADAMLAARKGGV